MKKIGLLIPSALCAMVPVVTLAACSKGSPTVQIDGEDLIIVRNLDQSFNVTFNTSKELTDWTLKKVELSGVEQSKCWVGIVSNATKVEGKKITVTMVAPSEGFTSRPDIVLNFNFTFTSSKGDETRTVNNITFTYHA